MLKSFTLSLLISLMAGNCLADDLENCQEIKDIHDTAFHGYCYNRYEDDINARLRCAEKALSKEQKEFWKKANCSDLLGS